MNTLRINPSNSIQSAVDYLANVGGGYLYLEPGVYTDVTVNLPRTTDLKYSNIKIYGYGAKLVSPVNSTEPVIGVAQNYDNIHFLTGIEICGVEIEHLNWTPEPTATLSNRKGISILGTDGALIKDVTFTHCPLEALYEGGINTKVYWCRAYNCGHNWLLGKLAAFNLNGMSVRGFSLVADKCGIGFETAATGGILSHSSFLNCDGSSIGSASWGISNFKLVNCNFIGGYLSLGNGIGRLTAIQILNNTFLEASMGYEGGKPTDAVPVKPDWFIGHTDGPVTIMGNSFTGNSGFYCNGWSTTGLVGHLEVISNFFNTDSHAVLIQTVEENPLGTIVNDRYYKFSDNFFSKQQVGVLHPYKPGGGYVVNPWARFTFERNRCMAGAFIHVYTSDVAPEYDQLIG